MPTTKRTVPAIATPDDIPSAPDVQPDWDQYIQGGGSLKLRSHWEFMRSAEQTFRNSPALTEVWGWTLIDSPDLGFLVRVTRRRDNRTIARYEIIGAVRLAESAAVPLVES